MKAILDVDAVEVNAALAIPRRELKYETSRSGGPGGQHVNKVETRVTLVFDVANSPSLTETQRTRLQQKLASRLTRDGLLRVSAQTWRSQAANRREAEDRFVALLRQALARRRRRRRSDVPAAQKRRRLEEKRRLSRKKARRRPPDPE